MISNIKNPVTEPTLINNHLKILDSLGFFSAYFRQDLLTGKRYGSNRWVTGAIALEMALATLV
jgi:hypothetical protein